MLALHLHAPAPIETAPLLPEDVPIPEPSRGELRVRVHATGICRTDLHVIEGDLPFPGHPVVPGHQVVGVVDAVGPGVADWSIGDRVGIAWLRSTCGECVYCREGRENLCENAQFTGYHADGGFAEYALVPTAFAYPIPNAFEDVEAAPLLCAGIIGYRALKRSELKPRQRLGIYGFGSSAHVTLQIAKHWGCEVFVATRGERHRAFARQLGADWVGGATDRFPTLVDSAIIFAPAGNLVPEALMNLRKGGTVACAGIHMSEIPALEYERHLFYEKNLRSVTANTREDGRELLRLAAEIPIRPHIETFQLAEANLALQKLKHDGIHGTGVLRVV